MNIRTEVSALLEVALMLLPGIPAILWLWPALRETPFLDPVMSLAYIYIGVGALLIGRRRWNWAELGLSWQGFWPGLFLGCVLVFEHFIAHAALGFPVQLRQYSFWRILGEIVFYIGLVGIIEEFFFRGVIFRIILDWHGALFAVIGQAFVFALWHIGWAGTLIVAHFLLGIFFGLVRLRVGSIWGLALAHGIFDIIAVEAVFPVRIKSIDQLLNLHITNPWAVVLGDGLLLAVIGALAFWPRLVASINKVGNHTLSSII